MARALVSRPRIVFADEPTGNLDSRSGAEVLGCCAAAPTSYGQTIVMVTHDPVAAAYTDRVVFLADGRVVDEMPGPEPRAGARDHDPDVRARGPGRLTMLRAALKSLLGRKVRLLMSTFAIVLGVAFVVGSLVFSDTLSRSFTALFASTVGDVVVRPEGTAASDGTPSTRTVPARVLEDLRTVPGAARVDGNVNAVGVFVIGKNGKVVGGFGPPAIGANWSDAPAGHGLEGLSIIAGREPRGPDEVVLDARTAEKADYHIGERIHVVTSSHPGAAGAAAGRRRRLHARRLAQRRDAERSSTRGPRSGCSSRAGTPTPTCGSPRTPASASTSCATGSPTGCHPPTRPSPGTRPPTRPPAS